jgi:hypothetical protein
MPDVPFDAAARASAFSRTFVDQTLNARTQQDAAGAESGTSSSFGELLLKRQATLGGPLNQVITVDPVLPPVGRPAPGGQADSVEVLPPARPAVAPEASANVKWPDAQRSNEFGHWDLKPAKYRPFFWIPEEQLTEKQAATVEKWKASPYNMVWTYEVSPSKENNWAGWGPPPAGYYEWSTFEKFPDGSMSGRGNPWPPPGIPPANWVPRA